MNKPEPKQPIRYSAIMRNLDTARKMISTIWDSAIEYIPFCQRKPECYEQSDNADGVSDAMCRNYLLEWLNGPVSEDEEETVYEIAQEAAVSATDKYLYNQEKSSGGLENGFLITNADGTPVDLAALGEKYKNRLCNSDIDGFYIGQNGELALMDDCGNAVPVDRGDYHIQVN